MVKFPQCTDCQNLMAEKVDGKFCCLAFPDGIPDEDAGMVKITEEEFRIYSRAVLVVLTLRDLLQAMEEFKNE